MSEELQRVIEALAKRLRRNVAVDDVHLRLLAYTAHGDEVDEIRTRVILDRQAPPAAVEWVRGFQLPRADGPVRIPENAALGFRPRVAIPVRHQSVHFGYLWLIDLDASLTDQDIALAEQTAADVGEVLFRERVVDELHRAREGELVRDLLSDDGSVRELAAARLVETGMFATRGGVLALVLRPLPAPGKQITERHRLVLAAVAEHAASTALPRECLTLVRPDHAVLVVTETTVRRNESMAADLQQLAEKRFGDDATLVGVVVGAGAPSRSLADVMTSYRQANHAAQVSEIVPLFRPVARYTDLGVYALLLRMGADQLTEEALPEPVRRLLHGDRVLLRTAEAFLDRAADSRVVAAELATHRATVYQRLRRIEQLAGVDLSDGEQRLALHLGIKLARLLKLY
jgi:sugar diacid utilization regulator